MAAFTVQKSGNRHFADHGWLKTAYSFSFADYHDPQNIQWGPLRVFNDDRISAGKGFDFHPHADMEILTYVLSGELTHRDSMGNEGTVTKSGVQYMSAGTGVVHAEHNRGSDELHLVQMWVLPDKKFHTPQYGQVDFTEKDRTETLLRVASGQSGTTAPIAIHQNATLYVSKLQGNTRTHVFEKNRLGFLFVADGNITANGIALEAGDAVRMAEQKKLDLEGKGEIVFWDLLA